MSWSSVVDDGTGGDADTQQPPAPTPQSAHSSTQSSAQPPVGPGPGPDPVAPDASITLTPLTLSPLTLEPLADESITGRTAPAVAAAVGTTPPVEKAPPVVEEAPPVVKLAPLVPIVPAIGDVEPAPTSAPQPSAPAPASTPIAREPANRPAPPAEAAPEAVADASGATGNADPVDVISTELPQIVEATPVPEVAASEMLADADPASLASGPRLPTVQQPDRARAVGASMATPIPDAPAATTATRHRRKRRRGLKLVLTLVVLCGLVAAGVVYGREYLIPSEWDSTTEPYAVAVEEGRNVGFVEPIELIAEPTAAYTTLMAAELTGDWSDEQSTWRALGLLSGPTTEQSVAAVLEGWQDAVYSTDDGQVYRDAAATGPQLEARITEAMVAASLDQEFGWSAGQPARTLDDAAQTLAEVRREARRVQRSSPFAAELETATPAAVVFVPPVLGYRTFAPEVFSEFENPAAALDGIGTGGPGPLPTFEPVPAPNAAMIGADVVATSPVALDRSFWYLVFAGYLDTRTAYQASEAVVENSLVVAERGGGQCVYATFAGGDVAQTATLRSALESWSATVPAEFASTFSVLDDGTLQLVSCDPGAGFENPSRLGVARELIGWRTAELATLEAVGDNDAEFAQAWSTVEASNVGVDLAALPADTTPAQAATAARTAVGAVLRPAG